MPSHTKIHQRLPTLTLAPSNSAAPTIDKMLGHMSCDPIHLHYHGPPSPGLQDDYFELSESMLVRKLHDLRTKNQFSLTNVPSLLGPISYSSAATSVASEGVSVPVCDSILVQPVVAANPKCMEEDNTEKMEVSEDGSPTNNGCEEMDELEKPAQRRVDSKKKQIDSDITVEKISPSSSSPTKRPLEVMSEITKPDRSKKLDIIGGSTSPKSQKQGEKLNDHYINLLPWEGREISIPSTYSSNSITLSRTSNLPPPPKAVSPQSNLKLRLCPTVDNENNPSQSTPQVDASWSPTAAYCMDERRINSYKKLRTIVTPSFDTVGSDATSATASISVSSSSQPSSCNNPFLRLMDRDGNEENVYDEDDDVYDDEVSMLMRVVTEEGEDIDEEEDREDEEGDHCDKQSEDATLTENVLLTEAIDWFEPVREEEVDEGKNLSSTQSKNQNSIKSLDMIRSSSFSSSVQVEGAASGGDTKEAEDGGPSYCPDSPKRQSSLGSLDLIRSSSFSSSIRDTPTEDTGDNSVSGTSSCGVSGGLRKSLTWRIGVIGGGQKQQSEHEDSSSGRVSNSTTGTQLTPLTPLSLTRVSSPSSIDSTMTPSQYQWQERSLSSLSTSVSTGPTSYARSMPIRSNLKKKKRVWKIGKRNRSSKLQQASPPTTLMEEEEQPPSPVKERNGIIKFTKEFPKHKGRRRADLNSYPYQCKQLIKKNHKAMLSEELFMKLADEDDFDEFIKLNRISFGGDMLLGRMLRERTRIQCKRDMLHNELEMYVKVHCATLRTSGEKSVTGNSEKSDERSVLFAI